MSHWYQKITKTKFGTIRVKILSQIGPKIDENGEKCRKSKLDFCPDGRPWYIVQSQANSHIKATGRTLSVGFIFS